MKHCILLASVLLIAACKKEKSNVGKLEDSEAQDTSISKTWNFSLMPTGDYKHNDNDTIKGFVSSDFGVGIGEFKNITLIENGNEITGYCNTFYLEGSRKGDSIYLSVYEHKDGPFSEHEKYLEVSKMRLQYSPISNGILKGKGQHTVNRANDGNDEYDVYATVTNINRQTLKTTIDFCSIVSTVESYAITAFTGGTFAPFGSCYPTKDGGGYYLLGQDGPGNGRLFLTSTIYEPLEWSTCGVRSYGFTISKRGNVMNIDQAINAVKASEKFLKIFGINDHDALSNGLRELYNEVGDFAISLGFDSNTGNVSIYVNHSGSSVKNNSLVKSLVNACNSHFGSGRVGLLEGNSISDSWHLRRSDFIVCNSPLVFTYIAGTSSVHFD